MSTSSSPEVHYSLDKSLLQFHVVHGYLSGESYWAKGISEERLRCAIDASLCGAAYVDGSQIAFMRIITDYVSFAYLADVFVLPAFQGRGIGKALVAFTMAAPGLSSIRRFLLATRDAHGLYQKLGFTPLADPARYMERMNPHAYQEG